MSWLKIDTCLLNAFLMDWCDTFCWTFQLYSNTHTKLTFIGYTIAINHLSACTSLPTFEKMTWFPNIVEICQIFIYSYIHIGRMVTIFCFTNFSAFILFFRTKMIGLSQGSGPCISRRFASESFITVSALFNYQGTCIQPNCSSLYIKSAQFPH